MQYLDLPSFLPTLEFYSCLVPKHKRDLSKAYLRYLLLLAKKGLHQKYNHPKSFNLLYGAVGHTWSAHRLLGFLQQQWIKENMSLSLLMEPVDGFSWLFRNEHEISVLKAMPVLMQIMTPITRFIAVLNNQTPAFYQPFNDLMFGYMALYLQYSDKAEETLKPAHITLQVSELNKHLSVLAHEALQLMHATNGLSFRLKIGVLVALFQIMEAKHQEGQLKQGLNVCDKFKVFFKGLWYMLTIRNKTKGLNKL